MERERAMARVALTVRGSVQGVGFRWFIVREAGRLGLVGWVANAADGTVRLEAEGSPEALERLVGLVRDGPPGAAVESVSRADLRPRGDELRFTMRALAHGGD